MKKVNASFHRLLNAKGYIDPSVMTIAIQAIAGVAIAVGAFLAIHFRKAKKKLAEKLNIDENRNKEVEGDDLIITDEATEAPEAAESAEKGE